MSKTAPWHDTPAVEPWSDTITRLEQARAVTYNHGQHITLHVHPDASLQGLQGAANFLLRLIDQHQASNSKPTDTLPAIDNAHNRSAP